MSLTKLLTTLLLAAVFVGAAYYAYDSWLEIQDEVTPRRPRAPPELQVVEPQDRREDDPASLGIQPLERRRLEIVGRVFVSSIVAVPQSSTSPGEDLEEEEDFATATVFESPGGGRVLLGDEVALVDRGGSFRFPAALRSRFLSFVFVDGAGFRREFPLVVTGDEAAGTGTKERVGTRHSVPTDGPARPRRLEWTLILPAKNEETVAGAFWIAPDEVLVEEWGRGARIRVRGRSNLPDGMHVYANVSFDGLRLAGSFQPAKLLDGSWSLSIPVPESTHLFAGRYKLEASFNFRLENGETLERLTDDEVQALKSSETEVLGGREIFVGSPAVARREDLVVQNYYRPLIDEARRLHTAFMNRIRDFDTLGKGWDPSLVQENNRAHGTWFRETFIGEDGQLAEGRWREFLDVRWRPAIRQLLDKHRERSIAKYRKAESRMEGVLDSLLRLSRLCSTFHVYKRFNLPVHENDLYAFELQTDIALLNRRLKENFFFLKRFTELVPEKSSKKKTRRRVVE